MNNEHERSFLLRSVILCTSIASVSLNMALSSLSHPPSFPRFTAFFSTQGEMAVLPLICVLSEHATSNEWHVPATSDGRHSVFPGQVPHSSILSPTIRRIRPNPSHQHRVHVRSSPYSTLLLLLFVSRWRIGQG